MSAHHMTPSGPVSPPTAGASPPVSRFHCPGLILTTLDHGGLCELHLTLTPLPEETWAGVCRRLHDVLRDEGAGIAWQMVLGNVAGRDEALAALKREFGRVSWPVTWTEGGDLWGRPWSGLQLVAIRGATVEPIEMAGEILGCQYRSVEARRCLLGGIAPDHLRISKPAQAARAFDRLEMVLAQVGLSMAHVMRTWLFLDDILDWYDEFNEVRTGFYVSRRVFGGLVPASTGVGARNPRGAAVAAAALAFEPAGAAPPVAEVGSPLQCAATLYGSSFSRAVEVRAGRCRQVIVSGTASIDAAGDSARADDLLGQIELTCEVVERILKSRGLGFADTTRAIAYFKTAASAALFTGWLAGRGFHDLPIVSTVATICREELLFELELDAAGPLTPTT
jgi:enamine deaminase RidA (YjgF/YER057c/UK114 family)